MIMESLRSWLEDPEQLEDLYRSACQEGKETEFAAGLMALHAEYPENILLKAWYYRLLAPVTLTAPAKEGSEPEAKTIVQPANWRLLLFLGFLNMAAMYFLIERSIECSNQRDASLPRILGAGHGSVCHPLPGDHFREQHAAFWPDVRGDWGSCDLCRTDHPGKELHDSTPIMPI